MLLVSACPMACSGTSYGCSLPQELFTCCSLCQEHAPFTQPNACFSSRFQQSVISKVTRLFTKKLYMTMSLGPKICVAYTRVTLPSHNFSLWPVITQAPLWQPCPMVPWPLPPLPLSRDLLCVSVPPTIADDQTHFTVTRMAPVVLTCHSTGSPAPVVSWSKAGTQLGARGSGYRVLPSGE